MLYCGDPCSSKKRRGQQTLLFLAASWLGWNVKGCFYSCLLGSILFKYMTMESEKISEKQEEVLSILEEKFPSLPPREDIVTVLQESHSGPEGE